MCVSFKNVICKFNACLEIVHPIFVWWSRLTECCDVKLRTTHTRMHTLEVQPIWTEEEGQQQLQKKKKIDEIDSIHLVRTLWAFDDLWIPYYSHIYVKIKRDECHRRFCDRIDWRKWFRWWWCYILDVIGRVCYLWHSSVFVLTCRVT